MYLCTLEYMGADPADLRRALSLARDLGPSYVAAWRRIGEEARDRARSAEAAGQREQAQAL